MRFENCSFPHPVLGLNDDIRGVADAELTITETGLEKNYFPVTISYTIANPDIEELIANNRASYFCEVSCTSTVFRKVFTSPYSLHEFQLEKDALRGKVDFLFLVVATEAIPNYINRQAHPELQGIAVDLDPGDVLAYLGEQDFIADVSFLKLKSSSSFMEIVEGAADKGPFDVVLDNQKILIRLPKYDYSRYIQPQIGRNAGYASIFQSSVALPALVHALQQMANHTTREEYKDKAWAQTIQWRLENELNPAGVFLEQETVVDVAQKLLGAPVERLLTDLDNQNRASEDEE